MAVTDSRAMTAVERQAKQEQIVQHIREGKTEAAVKLCLEMLNENRDDEAALFQLSKVMIEQGNEGLAYNLMARALKLNPKIPEMWIQYAQCHAQDPSGWRKAEWCFRKGIQIAEAKGKQVPAAWSSIGAARYLQGDYEKALECCDKALEIKPDHEHALVTKSFIHLARREWDQAWELYDVMLRRGKRESASFGDEPVWDGTLGKRLIITGEQGIGDEIMYASCFQEIIDQNEHVVIECMPRLEKMFKRSFPGAAAVYGSRWEQTVVWDEDHRPDAHVAMATLPRYCRHEDKDFPGTPYLKPDPDMVEAVKGIFSKLGRRPKIGIAWTGGSKQTRGHLRERTLEELLPILRAPAVDWISLEYYNRDEEIAEFYATRKIPIHTYHWLTARGLDYDLTAALISQLDLLISVPTTGVQMAGALGVPCWVLVPKYTGWMFCHDDYVWANSVKPFRNPPIKDIEQRLLSWLRDREASAA